MHLKRFGVSVLVASFFATALTAQNKTMLLPGASGSMWGQIEGTAKITIARDTYASPPPKSPSREASDAL